MEVVTRIRGLPGAKKGGKIWKRRKAVTPFYPHHDPTKQHTMLITL